MLVKILKAYFSLKYEKLAEEYAKTGIDIDLAYSNGLYYGFMKGALINEYNSLLTALLYITLGIIIGNIM